jgi:hypothetical protein
VTAQQDSENYGKISRRFVQFRLNNTAIDFSVKANSGFFNYDYRINHPRRLRHEQMIKVRHKQTLKAVTSYQLIATSNSNSWANNNLDGVV